MTDLESRLRQALGLSAEVPLKILASRPLAEAPVGEGSPGALLALAAAVAQFLSAPECDRVDLGTDLPARVTVSSCPRIPGLLVLEDEGDVVEVLEGTPSERRDGLVFVRVPSVVRLPGEALLLDRRLITRVELPSALAGLDLPATSAMTDELLGDWSCPPELLAGVRELAASAAVLDRVASIGLLARLWEPEGAPGIGFEAVLAGQETPTDRARAWANGLGPRALEDLVAQVRDEAAALAKRLDSLQAAIAKDPDGAVPMASAFVAARDRVESLAFLARSAGAGASVNRSLEELDREAVARGSMFALLPPLPRLGHLHGVRWQEPTHWWGQLMGDADAP